MDCPPSGEDAVAVGPAAVAAVVAAAVHAVAVGLHL